MIRTVMTAHRSAVVLAAVGMLGAACGSGGNATHRGSHGTSTTTSAVDVIRAWSTALRNGDSNNAARYFALPSEFVNGPGDVVVIRNEGDAQDVNASLPCGAVLISTRREGAYVSALFRLTDRPGGGCGAGIGQLARTNFLIENGHIVEWIRAPLSGGVTPVPPPPARGGGPVV
jgi:hypothetical protein